MDDVQAMIGCFRAFLEGGLVEQDVDAVMQLFTDDLMGIGMGAQGIVRCKEDVRPILSSNKHGSDHAKTTLTLSNLQVRCYESRYGSVCAEVGIMVEQGGKRSSSRIGQCASLRKQDGVWKIYMLQATPLSINASELEAYPLSFAEDELENYRMLEQMSEAVRHNTMALYRIDFTSNTFEQHIPMAKHSVRVEKGARYEQSVYCSADTMPNYADRLRFIETFCLENVRRSYRNGKQELTLDYESKQPDGSVLWLRSILRIYLDKSNRLKGNLYLINIDQQKRSELEMRYRAETDAMTGLLNQEITRKKIDAYVAASPQAGALLMIDLDYFKQVNDTFGHSEGDRIIQAAAKVFQEASGSCDVVGRLGGDEFAIFYTGKVSRAILCQRMGVIQARLGEIRPGGTGPSVTCSIGVVCCAGEGGFEDLYKKADKALYVRKKEQGRNGYTFYQE